MAKDNAIEFTESRYFSRREMGNELGIIVPEEMWKKVVNYRASFLNQLSLKDFNDHNLQICLYPTFASKTALVENKLNKLHKEKDNLNDVSGDKQHFRLSMLASNLKTIASLRRFELDEQRIKRLISSENPFDENEDGLLNYYQALEYVEQNSASKIDVDYLAELYSRVTGVSELTYFYRDNDNDDLSRIYVVGKSNERAPANMIEPLMESLFSFIETEDLSPLNKALITYYYTLYVSPFKDYNQEIAILLAKSVLARYLLEDFAILVPFEKFILEKEITTNKIFNEVRNTTDITYFVSPYTNILDIRLEEVSELEKDYIVSGLKHDFYQADEITEEVKKEPIVIKEEKVEEPLPVIEEKKEEVVSKPVQEEIIEENGQLSLFNSVIEEEEKKEPTKVEVIKKEVKPEPVKKVTSELKEEKKELAIKYIPSEIDEKDARRLEEHLLELDIRLKKGEAKFYARHCTVGMYYTIEQYRKMVKCVYETARTSMDHLAELGYYEKMKYGKKFVYTPVKRK